MSPRRLKLLLLVFVLTLTPGLIWLLLYQFDLVAAPGRPYAPPYNLSDRLADLPIDADSNQLAFPDGTTMTPNEFVEHLRHRQTGHPNTWLFRVLDITAWTSLFWVTIGLLGQVLFTGRMLVQWLASEKAKASVVPESFWWLSLFGASMLIVYFTWRIDIVGVLGQSTGWFIYVRNLWFLRERAQST